MSPVSQIQYSTLVEELTGNVENAVSHIKSKVHDADSLYHQIPCVIFHRKTLLNADTKRVVMNESTLDSP